MAKLEFILATILGLAIFLTDLIFGWLTIPTRPIPVIFIMAIIIGAIAGSHGEALIATMLTWIGGLIIGVLIAPIVFADILNPDQTILGLFIFVFIYSVRGVLNVVFEGNIVEIIIVGLFYLMVMLIVTPILYLFSFAFTPIGVVIGKFIRSRIDTGSKEPTPVVQEPSVIPSTPVSDEPEPVGEESLETEETESFNAEN